MANNTRPSSPPSFLCIDSHVHLWTQSQLPRLAWSASLSQDHILNRQQSISEYEDASSHPAVTPETQSSADINLQGFIYLETDRITSISPKNDGWEHVLEEVDFVSRIAKGLPGVGEHQYPYDRSVVLAIIPWAPVPGGAKVLDKYLEKVRGVCKGSHHGESNEETFNLIKGFRYLVQDKPAGTMLQSQFIDGLRWLRDNGYVFDLGVDARSGGIWQLEEAHQMLTEVGDSCGNEDNREKKQLLTVVINHCCKPNLRISPANCHDGGHEDFVAWKNAVIKLASIRGTFMKLSGLLMELPEQTRLTSSTIDEILETVRPWIRVIFSAFGPERVMFGSDWPVCTANGAGGKAWRFWVELVSCVLEDLGLSDEQKAMVWAGTARKAYGIASSEHYLKEV